MIQNWIRAVRVRVRRRDIFAAVLLTVVNASMALGQSTMTVKSFDQLSSDEVERLILRSDAADAAPLMNNIWTRLYASSSPESFAENTRLEVLLNRRHSKTYLTNNRWALYLDMGDADAAEREFLTFAGTGPASAQYDDIAERIALAKKDPSFMREFNFNIRSRSSGAEFMKAFRSWTTRYPDSREAAQLVEEGQSGGHRLTQDEFDEVERFWNERRFSWSSKTGDGCNEFREAMPKVEHDVGDRESSIIKIIRVPSGARDIGLSECVALNPKNLDIEVLGAYVTIHGREYALGRPLPFTREQWVEGKDVYRSTDTLVAFPLSADAAWVIHRHSRDRGGEVGMELTISDLYRVESSSVAFVETFEGSEGADGGEAWGTRQEFALGRDGRMHVNRIVESSDDSGNRTIEISSDVWTGAFTSE